MTRNYTNIVKFICCIFIFLHHFYLRSSLVAPWGMCACSIFFMLSTYGICKSLEARPVNFKDFVLRRLNKIYLPLVFVNITTVGISCINKHAIPIFNVFGDDIRLIPPTLSNIFCYTIGIHKIDSVTWFIDVLFICYIILFIFSKIGKNRALLATLLYVGILVVLTVMKCAPWYKVDIIGIYIGYLFYLKENAIKEYLVSSKYVKLTSYVLMSLMSMVVYSYIDNGGGQVKGRYMLLLSIFMCSSVCLCALSLSTLCRNNMKSSKIPAYFGGLSYFVYLVHVKVTCILHTDGIYNVLEIFFIIILVSIIFKEVYLST